MPGAPNLITRNTGICLLDQDFSDWGEMFNGAEAGFIKGKNTPVLVLDLSSSVRERVNDFFPPDDSKSGSSNHEKGWERVAVPDPLISLVQQAHTILMPRLGEHLNVPDNLTPIADSMPNYGGFHQDQIGHGNVILHQPKDMRAEVLRSIVTVFDQSAEYDARAVQTDLTNADAIGLFPGDAILFSGKPIHAAARAKDIGLTDMHPGLFGTEGSAHLLDLQRR